MCLALALESKFSQFLTQPYGGMPWFSLVETWVSLVIWVVPLFLGLPGVQGPASPVAIWACCPLRHARLVPGHLPTTGIMPLHVRHTNTTTVIGHGLSLLMHRIAQIVDGKLDTPLCSLLG